MCMLVSYLEVRGEWCTHHCPGVSSLREEKLLRWKGDISPVSLTDSDSGGYCPQPLVLAYSIPNRLRPPVDFFYAILYLRASFIDFILKKIMPRFSEDHFKNRPFIDFSACFERKATPTPCLWIRERWGRSFRQTLFWVKFYTLAYSRHFALKQLCLACEPPKVERGIFLILGGLFRLRSPFL